MSPVGTITHLILVLQRKGEQPQVKRWSPLSSVVSPSVSSNQENRSVTVHLRGGRSGGPICPYRFSTVDIIAIS
ncbi:hypothetical protein E2C01_069610 [Portunus trituberculatus]|uniref:Uncharacterized protein n=1 Tax=Portunus trituberculatus TaxID=210409 RepID=A0A5B7HZU5_PORTR|nr:hypothetical protein [Portunus trituberculatus]